MWKRLGEGPSREGKEDIIFDTFFQGENIPFSLLNVGMPRGLSGVTFIIGVEILTSFDGVAFLIIKCR